MSTMSKLTQNVNKSHIKGKSNKKGSIMKEFHQLYFDTRYCYDHWKVKMIFICMYNIYFLAIFNYASIEGDIFTLGMLFGSAEFLGLILGEPILKRFPDWLAMMFSLLVVMVCSVILKMPDVEQAEIYMAFLCQIFFIGISFNAAYGIVESRINPKLLAVAFELDLSFGNGMSMIVPILAKAGEPTPTLMFLFFGCTAILMLVYIGPKKPEKATILDRIE